MLHCSMKKILFLVLLTLSFNGSSAQWLPLSHVDPFPYYYDSDRKHLLVKDSAVYEVRSWGLEGINVNNGETEYHWENYYYVNKIISDTGVHYVYLKSNNYIGRYNASSQQYEKVLSDSLQNETISD